METDSRIMKQGKAKKKKKVVFSTLKNFQWAVEARRLFTN